MPNQVPLIIVSQFLSACLRVNASSCAEPRHAHHGLSLAQLMQVRVNAAIVRNSCLAPFVMSGAHQLVLSGWKWSEAFKHYISQI